MLKLIGSYKGSQPKRNGRGYLLGVEGKGFTINVVHVKNEDIGDFKDFKKGQEVQIPVYPFSFDNSTKVQYSYNKSF